MCESMPLRGAYSYGLKDILELLGKDSDTKKALEIILRYFKKGGYSSRGA
jgi:hypothetical protein